MEDKLVIIGIDSLDPYILLTYKKKLPTFSRLIDKSPTFISESVFPVDTIPAWGSIYTGLNPGNHGLLYVYDVFDSNLSDLGKLDINRIKGKTFWDYASQAGYKVGVVYPMLMYPSWKVNGFMMSKSPFDKRVDWIRTEIDISVYPRLVKEKYRIPNSIPGLWGGFPGIRQLKEWAEFGKVVLENEKKMGMGLYKGEKWDLFFMYFSILDIIQHRLWRFFDEEDPTYYKSNLSGIILDYYKMFDRIVEEFIETYPDVRLIVMSDHGHRSRPYKTFNLNEYLRRTGYVVSKGGNKWIMNKIKSIILGIANKLNIEHWLIKLVVKSQKLTKASKSFYSAGGAIDMDESLAYLSKFAGIKSYPHGGIEINKNVVSDREYEKIREEIIKLLLECKTENGTPLFEWVRKREDLYNGKFTKQIYPDIVFQLKEDYGVGWDLHSTLYGRAYDHKVASGGHGKHAVFLLNNISKMVRKGNMNIINVTPTILDLLEIDFRGFNLDGKSIFSLR